MFDGPTPSRFEKVIVSAIVAGKTVRNAVAEAGTSVIELAFRKMGEVLDWVDRLKEERAKPDASEVVQHVGDSPEKPYQRPSLCKR